MIVKEINTRDRKQVNEFIEFPFKVYAKCQQWVPPFEFEMRDVLNRSKHPFYLDSDAVFLMVYAENGEALGRVAILENTRYNHHNKCRCAFFYLFEVVDNLQAAETLFHAGEEWARKRELQAIIGPKGFTALNGLGMLIKGFEHQPALGIPYNHSYYSTFMQKMGYKGIRDVVSGYIDRSFQIPEKVSLIAEKVKSKKGLIVKQYNKRNDLRSMLPHLRDLYNGALVGTSGNAPLTDAEVKEMADQILWFADPDLIKILFKGEQPVGFLLAYPDISEALKKTKGKLWPFGWLVVLKELRKTTRININGAGIIEEYRGMGGTAVLFDEMAKSVLGARYQFADLVQVGTENERMQRELSSFGIDFYKTHRIYSKEIL